MSAISKIPFDLINLSKDFKVPSVPYSGWPPPPTATLLSNQFNSNDVLSTTDIQSSSLTPLIIDEMHHHHRKLSTRTNGKSYFEKLRSVAQDRRKSHLTTANISTSSENQFDNALGNLIGSIQSCHTRDGNDITNNKSQADILLSQFELLKQIYINNEMNKSIQKEEYEQNTQQRFYTYTFPIMTPDGNVLFDFSKQLINYDIYVQLMQLVRLSNLDKIIEKIFHKSGEYHHVDYKEKRRNQLEKDQENHQYQLKSNGINNTNCHITMAKAVHFRALSDCFVVDGIDISSRFQHDRNILRDTCLRFHRYNNTDSNTIQNENNDSPYITSLSDCTTRILVLCTQRMRKIYQLLESLLKSYISPNISVIYITFDQIEPFLTKYEQISNETLQKDALESPDFHNISSLAIPIENNILNQSTVLLQSVDFKKEFTTDTKVNDENIITSAPEENLFNKIDVANEEFLFDYLRSSSLVLIFMKNLDETYLTTFIRWYTELLLNSDALSTSSWNKVIEHFWFITSDYQRAETVFNIPKTNLFLWPTDHNDCDHISIIISSILILPIALSINYENYSKFIDGMSIVDKHCQETTIDRNVCIQMSLLRIWSSIYERKTTAIITCDDDLQYFGEYVQILLAEYEDIHQRQMTSTYISIHGMALAKIFFQQILNEQNHFSYDLIAISGTSQKIDIDNEQFSSFTARLSQDENRSNRKLFFNPHVSELLTGIEKILQENKTSHPHTFILLDQLTPLTLGVLIGVYQMSIFFENIIRDHQNLTPDLNQLYSDE